MNTTNEIKERIRQLRGGIESLVFIQVCRDRCLARGAAGSGRSDDNEESLKKRFVTAMDSTIPIIDHYRNLNLVSEVDADREIAQV